MHNASHSINGNNNRSNRSTGWEFGTGLSDATSTNYFTLSQPLIISSNTKLTRLNELNSTSYTSKVHLHIPCNELMKTDVRRKVI